MTIIEKLKYWIAGRTLSDERQNHELPIREEYVIPTPPNRTEIETPMHSSFTPPTIFEEKTPSPTSMPIEYFVQWCGSTLNYVASSIPEKKDPLKLDEKPLKRLLLKTFPWIIDVTEVRIKPKGRIDPNLEGAIYFGPLEIHITVSPTHHSELMNPNIEKLVRDKLYLFLLPLLTCMYENSRENPLIIFSPSHSETILEVL